MDEVSLRDRLSELRHKAEADLGVDVRASAPTVDEFLTYSGNDVKALLDSVARKSFNSAIDLLIKSLST